MSLNKSPDNIRDKPEKRLRLTVLSTPLISEDTYRKWWEDVQKRLKKDPHYVPIKSIPSEKELREFELD